MAAAATVVSPVRTVRPAEPRLKHRFLIFMLCSFAGWPNLKLANIQFLEMFMILHMCYLMLWCMARGFTVRIEGLWVRPGKWEGSIMAGIYLFGLASMRLPRFPPMYGPYFLHVPGLAVFMRLTELSLCVFYGFYAAELMRRDHRLREYAMKCVVWSAVVSAWLSFACFPIFRYTSIEIFVYGQNRARGGFTEGGPWGMYLVTACILARILWVRKELSQPQAVFITLTMMGAFVAARSKASAAAAILIFLSGIFFKSNLRQKITSVIGIALVLTMFWYLLDVPSMYKQFKKVRKMAEVLARYDRYNPNIAYGRIAAGVIIPRMIADHPISGIGFGNYPVMRNNPQYLGIMFPVEHYDLPGLGIISLAAELGIPSLLALYVMMFYPAYWAHKTGSHRLIFTLALCQPVVSLLGAQITYYYPWLMSGFALSFMPLAHKRWKQLRRRPQLAPQPGLGVGVTA
jgi:hypothetical protein